MSGTNGSEADNLTAVVFKKQLGAYSLRLGDQVITCTLSSKLRKQLIYPTADRSSLGRRSVQQVKNIREVDPVAVGDRVRFTMAGENTGVIQEVLPRRNHFTRPAAGGKEQAQVIAANIDQIVLIFAAAQPRPTWHLLDRYLVTAEAEGLPALICITKADLMESDLLLSDIGVYRRLGYPIIITSVRQGVGLDELQAALHGKLSVFVGKSGVGKTSLLNVLQPGLGLRVAEISESTGKGRHTTTHLEIFDLDAASHVVDTPGVKEFGLWGLDDYEFELDYLFPEMRPLLDQCQFGNSCVHLNEPGCAIKAGVQSGAIEEGRYRSYALIMNERK